MLLDAIFSSPEFIFFLLLKGGGGGGGSWLRGKIFFFKVLTITPDESMNGAYIDFIEINDGKPVYIGLPKANTKSGHHFRQVLQHRFLS